MGSCEKKSPDPRIPACCASQAELLAGRGRKPQRHRSIRPLQEISGGTSANRIDRHGILLPPRTSSRQLTPILPLHARTPGCLPRRAEVTIITALVLTSHPPPGQRFAQHAITCRVEWFQSAAWIRTGARRSGRRISMKRAPRASVSSGSAHRCAGSPHRCGQQASPAPRSGPSRVDIDGRFQRADKSQPGTASTRSSRAPKNCASATRATNGTLRRCIERSGSRSAGGFCTPAPGAPRRPRAPYCARRACAASELPSW